MARSQVALTGSGINSSLVWETIVWTVLGCGEIASLRRYPQTSQQPPNFSRVQEDSWSPLLFLLKSEVGLRAALLGLLPAAVVNTAKRKNPL